MPGKRETWAAGSTCRAISALQGWNKIKCSLCNAGLERIPRCSVTSAALTTALCKPETTKVVGRHYLTRQATTLLKFAKTVTDPNMAAVLVEKAAELKSQMDESNLPDKSPRAPDVERNDSPRTLRG
jgi:hypothetical protein